MEKQYQVEPVILKNAHLDKPEYDGDIYENRQKSYLMYEQEDVVKCSIVVTAWNRIEKTRYCVECILKYAPNISYELILVDNDSTDGTYEYFQSVPYENKVIVKSEKNLGFNFSWLCVKNICKGKYIVDIKNDVYLTKNALDNLLFCMESDPKIGNVMAMSSNVSNGQQVDLEYSDFDEMQVKAEAFNQRDLSKWEERMRLISLIVIYRREVLDIVGVFDPAFVHDFSEDDFCMRVRRAGYKMILCGDTWVCHDHDFRNMEGKDPNEYQTNLDSGRRIFEQKYHGIDAWGDINNFEYTLLWLLDGVPFDTQSVSALCVDVRCGTPVLEIRNRLRKREITDVKSFAYTTQAKYFTDLQTTVSEVYCDKSYCVQNYYDNEAFDIITLGEPINTYDKPTSFLRSLFGLLKPGGVLLFKLRNTDDYRAFLRTAGLGGACDPDSPSCFTVDNVVQCINSMGEQNDVQIMAEPHMLNDADWQTISSLLWSVNPNANDNDCARLTIDNYCFCAGKK